MEGVRVQGQAWRPASPTAAGGALPPPAGLADVVRGHAVTHAPPLAPAAGAQAPAGRPGHAPTPSSRPLPGGSAGRHPRPALPVPLLLAQRATAGRGLVGADPGRRVPPSDRQGGRLVRARVTTARCRRGDRLA